MQEEEESLEHPIDKHYKTLHCALKPLDHEHNDFKVEDLLNRVFMHYLWATENPMSSQQMK